jgi:aryl-alcohol dehydrogenase-like predicted oxidoreductase
MERRKLGFRQLQLSTLGLGCMGMSECYGKPNDEDSIKAILRAFELGVTHFDTADCYGFGHNERLLGKAIKSFRDQVMIASKCGLVRDPANGAFLDVNGTPDYIKKCCDDSLKRLDIDYLDIFYLHRVDLNTPIEVSMTALAELVAVGKIRHIGLSEVSAATISKAHQIFPLTVIQSEYSLWHREPEKEIIPLCKALNIGFVAHGPIGKGFLSGAIHSVHSLAEDDIRRFLPRFQDENISHNLGIVKILQEIAQSKGVTPAQIALAWILAQDDHIVAIPGAKSTTHLQENINATNINLSPAELLQIGKRIPLDFARGPLLPESFAQFSNR